jgi:hypothetical protein
MDPNNANGSEAGPRDASEVGHDIAFAVRWQNFRAFADTKWIAVKPLTLLLGPNTAGKSSFIAPLLLLKQSLYSRTGTNALLTRGDFIDVGVFEDFVRDHDAQAQVSLGLRWHSHPRGDDIAPAGRYPPGGLIVSFTRGPDPHSVDVAGFRVEDTYRRMMLLRERRDNGSYGTRMVSSKAAPGYRKRSSKLEAEVTRAMRRAITEARPTDFLFRSRPVREAGSEARRKADKPTFKTTIDDDRSRLYCSITDYAEWGVRAVLDHIHYIGPLREEPRRVYELSGEMPDSVGTRGEFAPEIVYRWRNDRRRLRDVHRWLRHFGFNDELEFRDVGTGGFAIVLIRDGSPVASTFVDTGFGLSQVLPLIVQGLLAEPGDWIVVEQPEIHLNPRLQAALADLFATIVERDVGLIIESHSEHLLLRLRRLIAESRVEPDDVGLYFVEQPDGRESLVRQVEIVDGGFISASEWPKGFFEDSLRESMALAQAQAKRRKRLERVARQEASDRPE